MIRSGIRLELENEQIRRIFIADIIALACLGIGGTAYALVRRKPDH